MRWNSAGQVLLSPTLCGIVMVASLSHCRVIRALEVGVPFIYLWARSVLSLLISLGVSSDSSGY